ncbi:PAS domain S-box-containing protein [Trichlorobacter thiogenes]|uniref:Sensory/regulatory protein RpfC n=1 Tax=Trichlorobacter thiogenes TaxID=115783 RepID=A0A1T4KDZ8_9BACT|nr:PAS domain S-box protein [Trichlorobacter thiogenes]SJZ40616.1 PAS domain S-box-containing protein [Trichlorobacter thiogenes]
MEQLRMNEEKLRLFVEYAPAALAMFDQEMRYLYASRRWLTDYQLGDRNLRGISHYDIFPEIPERWKELHRRCLAGEALTSDADRFIRADGSVQWLRWEIRPWFCNAGDVGGIVIFSEDITKVKQAEDVLRRYELLSKHSRDIALFVRRGDGRILEANDAAVRTYGYSREELLKLTILDLRDADHVHFAYSQMEEADTHGILFETVHCHKDGSTFPVEVSCCGVDIGDDRILLSLVRDISKRKASEDELKRNAEVEHARLTELEALMQAVPAAVLISHDPQCRVITGNHAAYEMLRMEYGTNTSKSNPGTHTDHFRVFHGGKELSIEELPLQRAVTSGVPVCNFEEEIVFDNGDQVSVYGNAVPLKDTNGNITGVVAAFVDIGQRVRAEEEAREAREAAEAANRAKSAFLANMSHEIRTPLNGIVGTAQLLEFTRLTNEQKEYLADIKSSSCTLLSLLNDVLDLSKIEAGKITLESIDFRLRSSIGGVVNSLKSLAQSKGLPIEVHIPDGVPDCLKGDQTRFKQVLLNLLGNAVKFTEAGTVSLSVAVKEQHEDQLQLEIEVKDTGIGISSQMLETIFEPFTQAEATLSKKYGGTGLGLAICKRLINMMGGQLWAESIEGAGSTFHLIAPFSVCEVQDEDGVDATVPKVLPEWSGPQLRILLADDHEINLKFTSRLLEKFGHTVMLARDGQEALQAWEQHDPDLILMDVSMPILSGIEAVGIIREKELASNLHVPIVALTGHATLQIKEQVANQGFDGCLIKPIPLDVLLQELQRHFPA